jgi:hypothetical protein
MNNLPQENKKTMSYHKENNYDKKIVELINWKCLKFNCLEFWDLQKSKYVQGKPNPRMEHYWINYVTVPHKQWASQ